MYEVTTEFGKIKVPNSYGYGYDPEGNLVIRSNNGEHLATFAKGTWAYISKVQDR